MSSPFKLNHSLERPALLNLLLTREQKIITMFIKIIDNPSDKIIQTEYYRYLLNLAPQDIHSIKTKTEFLKSAYNFKIRVDKVSSEDLQTLKAIEETYFHLEIKKNK